jgi:hypothetical protein
MTGDWDDREQRSLEDRATPASGPTDTTSCWILGLTLGGLQDTTRIHRVANLRSLTTSVLAGHLRFLAGKTALVNGPSKKNSNRIVERSRS